LDGSWNRIEFLGLGGCGYVNEPCCTRGAEVGDIIGLFGYDEELVGSWRPDCSVDIGCKVDCLQFAIDCAVGLKRRRVETGEMAIMIDPRGVDFGVLLLFLAGGLRIVGPESDVLAILAESKSPNVDGERLDFVLVGLLLVFLVIFFGGRDGRRRWVDGVLVFGNIDGRKDFKVVGRGFAAAQVESKELGVIAALGEYKTWLQNDLLQRSTGEFAFGEETYRKKLAADEMIDVPLDTLLATAERDLRKNQAAFAEAARLIDPKRAQHFGPGNPLKGGTIYLSAADERGMMVSFIQSNYMGFGSGVVVPGYGVSLQNRGHGFSLDPQHPNCVAPGKRPFHTIIPAFLTRDGQAQMSFGVMGGNMQPQGHLQTLVRMLDHRQNPQAACDAPRWRFNQGLEINVEATMNPALVAALQSRGHRVEVINDSYQDFGAGQFIWRLGDPAVEGYVAASDARRDGQAAAF